MAFAIFDTATNVIHSSIALRKTSGRVTAPQLFCGNRPILYRATSYSGSPKVTSTTWHCCCQDPTQSIYHHAVNGYSWGGTADENFVMAGITKYKMTNKSSGLTVNVKGLRNNYNDGLNDASLRILRTSISTNYINVFEWVWLDNSNIGNPGLPFAQWSSDSDWMNIDTASIYPYREQIIASGSGSSGKIDNTFWGCIQRWGTIKKATSGTYLYVATPLASIRTTVTANVKGWGIILEPTNSNTYPV